MEEPEQINNRNISLSYRKICLETEKTEGHTLSRTLVKFLYAKRDRGKLYMLLGGNKQITKKKTGSGFLFCNKGHQKATE